ncbi:MAG: vWA domain-containing protein [Promethearchaeota archaeon]
MSRHIDEAIPALERKKFISFGRRLNDEEYVKAEIIRGGKKPEYYEYLSKSLGYLEVKRATETAIKYNNPEAVLALLRTNLYAASSALTTNEGAKFLSRQEKSTQGNKLTEIFFMVRTIAPPKFRKLMRRITRNVILKMALKIVGRGIEKGMERKRIPYYPGMPEWDLELTLYNILPNMAKYFTYTDIVGIRRTQLKKNIVLILDTSGSMYGRSLTNAALTTGVLSYVMMKHKFGVILFNSNAMVLKHIGDNREITEVLDDILDSEAVGFTNIERGLKEGLKELDKVKNTSQKNKIGILITDGDYNRGRDPVLIAKKYPNLHVIAMPPEKYNSDGMKICRKIAESSNGLFYPVRDYKEIPRALLRLLKRI